MPLRYQHGYLRCVKGKTGPSRWEFLWREDFGGRRIRRTTVIGSVDQYPTEELAHAAVNGFRVRLNENRNRQREQVILVADLVDHYIETELSDATEWRAQLSELETPFRLMVLLDATTGLRRSELLALKWCDVDFSKLTIDIRRSIYCRRVGNCKTKASRRPVPLDLDVAADLPRNSTSLLAAHREKQL